MGIIDSVPDTISQTIDPIAAGIKNPFSTTVKNNGERGADFPGGFQIEEFVDGVFDKNTKLSLVGNMMPMQPFPWEREQRLVKDYYPGNPEATVHVLGAKHGPLQIHGRFKDKRFRDPAYYGVSYQICRALEEMAARGNLLRFGIQGKEGNWIRWGFLEKVNFKMNKLSWIDYDLDFFIVSDKQPINNYFAAPEKQAPSDVNQNLINKAVAFNTTYSAIPKTMPQSIGDVLNGVTSSVAKSINLVTNFVGTIISTAEQIDASAHRALGLIKNARANISAFNRRIDSLKHDYTSFSSSGNQKTQATDTYRNVSFIHEAMAGTHQLSRYLAQMQVMFEALAKTVPKARYKVQTGDTLQNISLKFYGASDNWGKIQDHNKLQSTVLVPGTVLEIPKL